MSNSYEEKKEARVDRYKAAAERARQEAQHLRGRSDAVTSAIPLGQPLLLGHHSYKADRRRREKAFDDWGKSIQAEEKAQHYEYRAEAAENNTAISSDDPAALEKLKAKLEKMEANHSHMKRLNAHYRKHGTCKGFADMPDAEAEKRDTEIADDYSFNRKPFPSWALSNHSQNMRQVRKRIEELEKHQSRDLQGWDFDGGTVVMNKEDNRLQIFFDGKPGEEIRGQLKGQGFRWAPSVGAWQRQLNQNALFAARQIDCLHPKEPAKKEPEHRGHER